MRPVKRHDPAPPTVFESSLAGDNSVWRRPSRLLGGAGDHIMSGVGSIATAKALARLLDEAEALAPLISGNGKARLAGAVAKAMGGSIDLESFGLL